MIVNIYHSKHSIQTQFVFNAKVHMMSIYSARLHCQLGPPAFHVPWQVASYPAHTEQNVMWPPVSCQLIGLRARPHRCLPTVI